MSSEFDDPYRLLCEKLEKRIVELEAQIAELEAELREARSEASVANLDAEEARDVVKAMNGGALPMDMDAWSALIRERDELRAEVGRLKALSKRSLSIITDAICHGMPVTPEVASVWKALATPEPLQDKE